MQKKSGTLWNKRFQRHHDGEEPHGGNVSPCLGFPPIEWEVEQQGGENSSRGPLMCGKGNQSLPPLPPFAPTTRPGHVCTRCGREEATVLGGSREAQGETGTASHGRASPPREEGRALRSAITGKKIVRVLVSGRNSPTFDAQRCLRSVDYRTRKRCRATEALTCDASICHGGDAGRTVITGKKQLPAAAFFSPLFRPLPQNYPKPLSLARTPLWNAS